MIHLQGCIVAFIGGALGAALSALGSFVLFGLLGALGFLSLFMTHNGDLLNAVTRSALLKPSVCFLGGVIATAYARKKGLIECGKDIGRSFISKRRFDILLVGGAAGLAGFLMNRAFDTLLAGKIDTIALTVFLIPLFFKYLWHMTKTNDCEASSHAVPSPYRFFEKLSRPEWKTVVALMAGLFTTLLTIVLFKSPETRPYAGLFIFFISALSLFPLFMGIPIPATHHFTGPSGAITVMYLSLHSNIANKPSMLVVIIWGLAAAQIGLLAGNIMGKLFFTEGDIHVDPPAMGILCVTGIMLGILPITGIYHASTMVQMVISLSLFVTTLTINFRKN